MRIVVLAGGLSPERNVSLSSGTKICKALRERGHQAVLVDMFLGLETYTGAWEDIFEAEDGLCGEYRLGEAVPDLEAVRAARRDKSPSLFGPGVLEVCRRAEMVFLALHGEGGEDGRVQAAFDLLGIPYTGSGCLGSAIAMNKDVTKRLVAHKVRTPAWRTVDPREEAELAEAERFPLPCVVKPVDGGSSIGVVIAQTEEELRGALDEARAQGKTVVIEQYIRGRELQVGILEGKALPVIEIIPKSGFYDYVNKYQSGAATECCPALIPEEWERELRASTETVFRTLGLAVYARADYVVTEAGEAYFLEINTLPGMTPTSLLPQEAAAVGISYGELCERIILASLKRTEKE
ncbi:MAG: D-alanine--D-alanine ligase [Oscillospiraceae bacterium]